ncbi:bifunctional alpha/beta hydrolase/OsmC family protein [Nafulsella turpanensis]|uniref:bifunctional alpha/beta hydrolase/OsmC family protein n=1 Tax=Nafulsella turpanensis TaxID=1265690 RepID=UPI00034B374B|nr:OsmC family protein [Nafulsella turpanensis]
MRTTDLTLSTFSGNQLLAQIDWPAGGQPLGFAVFTYCFSGRQQSAVENISLALTQNRLALLRLDFSGYQSKGGHGIAQAEDLLAAVEYLAKEKKAPVLMIGHSVAGAAMLALSSQLPSVKAMVTIGAPAHEKYLQPVLDEDVHDDEYAEVVYSETHHFNLDLELLDAFDEKRMQKQIPELNKALLIMHSPQDRHISVDSAAELYTLARHPKSFITLDGADHFLSKAEDSLYAGNMIAAWMQRYLQLEQADELRTHMEVVTRTAMGGFTTEIRAGKHSLLADEPLSYGGADLGPNPYDLLNAALGACTSMTLRMYADRKKWPLEEAVVHLKHDKTYEEDCAACDEKGGGKLDRIDREIELVGKLTDEQRRRLMEIADKCPVHKTLLGNIRIYSQELKKEE